MLRRVLVFLLCLVASSCSVDKKEYKGGFGLKKTKFSELKKWDNDDLLLFDKTIKTVCRKIESNGAKKFKSDVF